VTIQCNKGMDMSDFKAERHRVDSLLHTTPSSDFPGLGDAAHLKKAAMINQLTFLKGKIRVSIVCDAPFEKEKQLAELIIAKL
jgi:hypothetical protein